MADQTPRKKFERGSPLTFKTTTTANGGMIKRGQLVEPDGTTGKIKVCGDESQKCLGVASTNAASSDYATSNSTDPWGDVTVTMHGGHPRQVAVDNQGVWLLTASGAIAFGALVCPAANGAVKAWDSASDSPACIVGRAVGDATEDGNGKAVTNGQLVRVLLQGAGA